MPKGVRGSGAARERVLSADKARKLREKLQAQLQQIEAHDAKRYALVGRVVMKLAESDDAFAAQLRGILDRGVTDRHERYALGLDEIARRGGRPRKAAGSQAGMQGPITASSESPGPTGPAEERS